VLFCPSCSKIFSIVSAGVSKATDIVPKWQDKWQPFAIPEPQTLKPRGGQHPVIVY
jgi:hypothetical protein